MKAPALCARRTHKWKGETRDEEAARHVGAKEEKKRLGSSNARTMMLVRMVLVSDGIERVGIAEALDGITPQEARAVESWAFGLEHSRPPRELC